LVTLEYVIILWISLLSEGISHLQVHSIRKIMFHILCKTVVSILALATGNPVYLISTKGARLCGRSAEDAYSSVAPDSTFAFVLGLYCPILDFVFVFLIMITLDTLLILY
jgi:hypothetical protein